MKNINKTIPIDEYIDFIDIKSSDPGFGNDLHKINQSIDVITKYGTVRAQCKYDNTIKPIINFLSNVKYPGLFVEIGVYGGATLLSVHEKFNENITIVGIDPFDKINIFNGIDEADSNSDVVEGWRKDSKKRKEKLLTIIRDQCLNINLLENTSWNTYNKFDNNSITCLHIDGDHSYEGLSKDLNLFWSKMQNGGMIIVDDYTWPACKQATDEFIKNNSKYILLDEMNVFNKKIFYKHER